ncbi:Imm1 family immunity protein [Chondromyces apiculatus]|uniref:Imm1 family immunity protein n=1 Tax=Chondromyces apiculatus TaxID=51 RepID=UPI0018CC0B06|nr:Imm1 family immunity protein [Chondromyces apiculatus]
MDGDRLLAKPQTWEELDREILNRSNNPALARAIVDIESPTAGVMSVGVSDGRACASFISGTGDPPYLKVVGEAALSPNDGVAVFTYGGDWTEIPLRNCISVDKMLAMVRHFFESGALPNWIEWEEV